MPRLTCMALAPAVMFLRPSSKIASARIVAVVVPSPATLLVLEATSLTIWAPIFSYESSSSISLATDTPSLVTVGLPKDFSRITLRPHGPSVTFTAAASFLTPSRIAARASVLNAIFFAAIFLISCILSSCVPEFLNSYSTIARMSDSSIISSSLSPTFTSVPA